MTSNALIRPFAQASTYKRLAFLASALPLGTAWFVLLVTGWSLGISLVVVFLLAIPVLLALAYATHWAANRERRIADALLEIDLARPRRPALHGSLIRRVRTWLGDPASWREQAYLLLRFLVGLPFGTFVIALAGTSLGLAAAPTWYWTDSGVLDYGAGRIDTIGEAFAVAPVGLVGLVLAVHAVRWMGVAWRGIASGLLGAGLLGAAAPVPVAATPAQRRPARARAGNPLALVAHAVASGVVFLLMVVIWAATTPESYFWPVWVLLPLALGFAVHLAAERGRLQPANRRALAIHGGVVAALSLFLIGIWAVTTPGGYFWPVWTIVPLMLPVGVHAIWAYTRQDRRIEELTASRAGAVDAQAAELRRIERDLHDGAQARLVALTMDLGMAEEKFEQEPETARRLMGEARDEARRALVELRDLARGIHPPVLTDRGLEAAVAALAARSPVLVTLSAEAPERAAAPVESAAYFTVAEALTNAAKHSGATRIDIRLAWRAGELVVEVDDDGVGGADPDGSGLMGLRRRVEALDGRFTLTSPPGLGTHLRAELPCAS